MNSVTELPKESEVSSESTLRNIYDKLQEGRVRLLQTKLAKSGLNKFAGYTYFELEDFMPKVQEICSDLRMFGKVSFKADEATLRVFNIDNPDESVLFETPMSTASLKGCHEVQNLGAVEKYLRRYLWVLAFEIVEHDGLDAGAVGRKKGALADAGESLDDDEKKRVKKVGIDMISLWGEGRKEEAIVLLRKSSKEAFDENEFKLAVWAMLSSSMRSEIKKMEEAKRKAEEK